MSLAKPRYDLFSLMEWTAAIAFLLALVGGSGGSASWRYDFTTLPDDDSALQSWLTEQDRRDVRLTRADRSIVLETNTRFLAGFPGFDSLPKPPWNQLGYSNPQGQGGSFTWTAFSGSIYLWLSGFGILFALGFIRRRYFTPSA